MKCARCLGRLNITHKQRKKIGWAIFETQYYHLKCLKALKQEIRAKTYTRPKSWLDRMISRKTQPEALNRQKQVSGKEDDY